MKIAYIVNTRIPSQRAHGFQIAKTCEKFAEAGNEVELWFPYRKNDINEDVFSYYRLKRNFKTRIVNCPDLVFLSRYIGGLSFAIQSFLFSFSILLNRPSKDFLIYTRDIGSVAIFSSLGYEVVYNVHNWSRKRKFFSSLFINKSVKVVCNSEGTKNTLIENGFKNCISVPNGVDIEDFSSIEESLISEARDSLPKNKRIVMYLGNLYKWKGVDVLIDTAKLMSDKKDIVFVVVGGDEDDIEKYSEKTNKECSNVIFMGHKEREEIPAYLTLADVLVLPNLLDTTESSMHTSPIKMFEYMASGKPIVASDLPSIREVLNDDNAVLVPPNDSTQLSLGITSLLGNEEIARKVSQNALQDVKKYTWNNYATQILDFIKK